MQPTLDFHTAVSEHHQRIADADRQQLARSAMNRRSRRTFRFLPSLRLRGLPTPSYPATPAAAQG